MQEFSWSTGSFCSQGKAKDQRWRIANSTSFSVLSIYECQKRSAYACRFHEDRQSRTDKLDPLFRVGHRYLHECQHVCTYSLASPLYTILRVDDHSETCITIRSRIFETERRVYTKGWSCRRPDGVRLCAQGALEYLCPLRIVAERVLRQVSTWLSAYTYSFRVRNHTSAEQNDFEVFVSEGTPIRKILGSNAMPSLI
jgi:hypothetical protein